METRGWISYFTLHPSFIHQNRQSAFDSSCLHALIFIFLAASFCCRPFFRRGAFEAGNDGSCRRQCILFAGDQSWQDECNWHIVTLGKATLQQLQHVRFFQSNSSRSASKSVLSPINVTLPCRAAILLPSKFRYGVMAWYPCFH